MTALLLAVLAQTEVHFSPNGGCTDMVVETIAAAKSTIRVEAYSFTSVPIETALVAAKLRGVDVEVILDASANPQGSKTSGRRAMVGSEIRTLIDHKHAIAHNKVLIIDGAIVLTGSFNLTQAAEKHNAENCLRIADAALAAKFTDNWHVHEGHSEEVMP